MQLYTTSKLSDNDNISKVDSGSNAQHQGRKLVSYCYIAPTIRHPYDDQHMVH